MLKKVDTFHCGPFLFSDQYQSGELTDLIQEAQVMWTVVREIPILPNLSSYIQDELIKRSIFGTAAIEGNPLTEDEVGRIISEDQKEKTIKKAELEIRNLKVVYDELVEGAKKMASPLMLSEELIREVNLKIMMGCEASDRWQAGNYRSFDVKVGDVEHGGVYVPPKELDDIRLLMEAFVEWFNSAEISGINTSVRAALAHYYLGRIHPFGDGNGRTARVVEAMILRSGGLKYVPVMLTNFYYKNIHEYFWAFSLTGKKEDGDITPFLEFSFRAHVESLKEIKDRILFFIRKFALRDFYRHLRDQKEISSRNYQLLRVLDAVPGKFSLKDLYDKPVFRSIYQSVSERTARRDLERMAGHGLLSVSNGLYELNFEVLDRE